MQAAANTGKDIHATSFRLVLATVFMLAQFISFSHASAFGTADHTHDGQPCIVSATCGKIEQLALDEGLAFTLHPAEHVYEHIAFLGTLPAATTAYTAIRAPPFS